MEENALSAEQMADRLAVSRQSIWLWLSRPEKHRPSSRSLDKIIALTKGAVTANDFFPSHPVKRKGAKHG